MGRAPLEVGRSAVLVGPAAMAVVVAPRLLLGRALAVAARAEAIKRVRQRHQRADADQGDPGPLRRALAHDDEQNADERQGEREAVADEPQQLRRQRGGGGAGPGAARVRAVTDEDAGHTAEATPGPQLSVGSSGIVESSANSRPLRRSTAAHSASGSSLKISSRRGDSTIQASSASSP